MGYAVAVGTSTHKLSGATAQNGLLSGTDVQVIAICFIFDAHPHIAALIASLLRLGRTGVAESALLFRRDAVVIRTTEREGARTGT